MDFRRISADFSCSQHCMLFVSELFPEWWLLGFTRTCSYAESPQPVCSYSKINIKYHIEYGQSGLDISALITLKNRDKILWTLWWQIGDHARVLHSSLKWQLVPNDKDGTWVNPYLCPSQSTEACHLSPHQNHTFAPARWVQSQQMALTQIGVQRSCSLSHTQMDRSLVQCGTDRFGLGNLKNCLAAFAYLPCQCVCTSLDTMKQVAYLLHM
jgi:hypothetical protein